MYVVTPLSPIPIPTSSPTSTEQHLPLLHPLSNISPTQPLQEPKPQQRCSDSRLCSTPHSDRSSPSHVLRMYMYSSSFAASLHLFTPLAPARPHVAMYICADVDIVSYRTSESPLHVYKLHALSSLPAPPPSRSLSLRVHVSNRSALYTYTSIIHIVVVSHRIHKPHRHRIEFGQSVQCPTRTRH